MKIKTIAAMVAVGAMCAVGTAGGEIQAYQAPYTGYGYGANAYGGAYAPPMPANYARPQSMYYGGYGCSPCASMPYGYSAGRPGFFGNDVFTAGLLGVGLGYLIFH